MWDGKADLGIMRKLEQIVKKNYYLEAVMTVEKLKGKLLLVSKMENFQEQLKKYQFPILIFRHK